MHNYTERKTFLPGINAFSGVDIEQADLLDEARAATEAYTRLINTIPVRKDFP